MDQIFPYANIIAGVLVLVVGFLFHWVGQLICLLNWEFATKIGVAEKGMIQGCRAGLEPSSLGLETICFAF